MSSLPLPGPAEVSISHLERGEDSQLDTSPQGVVCFCVYVCMCLYMSMAMLYTQTISVEISLFALKMDQLALAYKQTPLVSHFVANVAARHKAVCRSTM